MDSRLSAEIKASKGNQKIFSLFLILPVSISFIVTTMLFGIIIPQKL
jgi:hypothetical protein